MKMLMWLGMAVVLFAAATRSMVLASVGSVLVIVGAVAE